MSTKTLQPLKIVIVEDRPEDAELVLFGLRKAGFDPQAQIVETEAAFRASLLDDLDLVITDFRLPTLDAMRVLAILREADSDVPRIVVSGTIGEEMAVECLQAGATDYLLKDRLGRIGPAVRNALAQKRHRREQRSAAASLRLSDTILRNVNALVLVADARGDIIYVSPSITSILGYAPEEVLGDGWWQLTREDATARMADRELVARAAGSEMPTQPDPYERVVRRKGGERRVILWQDAAGPDGVLIGVGHDITERKAAEAQLARLASFPERDPSPIIELDPAGTITYLNPAARAQFPDMRAAGLSHPLLASFSIHLLKAGGASGRPLQREVRAGGRLFHATWSHAEDVNRYRLYLVDITDRHRAQSALEEQRQVAEALRDSAESLSQTLELDEVLDRILTNIQKVIPHDGARIMLIEDGAARVVRHRGYAERGLIAPVTALRLRPEETPNLQRMIQTAQPDLIDDTQMDAGWVAKPGFDWVRGMVGVPLRDRNQVIGFLTLDSEQPGYFTDEHLPVLRAFADQATQALTNARIFGEAQRRLSRLQGMRTVDTAITSSTDLKLTLSILVETLAQQLGAAAVDVLLLNPYRQMLEFAVGRGVGAPSSASPGTPLGQGHAGRAGLDRRPVSVPDLAHAVHDDPRAPEWRRLGLSSYLGIPLLVKGKLKGVLEVFHETTFHPDAEAMEFLHTMAGQAAIAIENSSLFSDLQRSVTEVMEGLESTLEGLARAVDQHNGAREGHSRRISETSLDVARRLGVGGYDLVHMRRSALLHDLGMLLVPDEALRRPGPLTDEEWALIHQHPQASFEWLSSIEILRPAAEAAYAHHERWDGSGYPRGLKGPAIPRMAAILGAVDVWHCLLSARPYRPALSEAEARAHLQQEAGRLFDPDVVRELLEAAAASAR